ncbi:MAG: DUF2150 family protein [Halobacteriaceae archaeon]
MSAPEEEFYSEERWENWLARLREEDLDLEEEDSRRLLWNLQDDVAIAVAKVLKAYDAGDLDDETAHEELDDISQVVLADPGIEDEDTAMLVDDLQTKLVVVFYAADQYVDDGAADEADAPGYIDAAAEAEATADADEDLDRALWLAACAGTRVIDGEELAVEVAEDLESGLVEAWVDGLFSLQDALADPEVVEDDDA